MHFSKLAFGALAVVAAALESPATPDEVLHAAAGTVVTNKGVTYQMYDLGQEIRAFDGRVDNGEFPRPVNYNIGEGFKCRFYLEATRGVGSPIGEFTGSGDFGSNWVAFYACWHTTAIVIQHQAGPDDGDIIPCGFTRTENGGNPSLSETGRNPTQRRYFAINGDSYVPIDYHVNKNCTCRFYGNTGRGGAELIVEAIGEANGDFGGKRALQYECWIKV